MAKQVSAELRHLLGLKEQKKTLEEAYSAQLALVARLMGKQTIEIDGTPYEVKDNFAETNHVFRPAIVHRFEVVEVK